MKRFSAHIGFAVALAALVVMTSAGAVQATPSSFQIVSSPTIPGGGALLGVAAVSPTDVWAVGSAGSNMLVESYTGAG